MISHKKYFCGPEAVRTAKLAKREVNRDVANEKAMRTLKIKSGKASDVVDANADVVDANANANAKNAKKKKPKRLDADVNIAREVADAMPTISNVYKELMAKAGRPARSMYEAAHDARANPFGGGGTTTTVRIPMTVRIPARIPAR
jgi:DNA repair protein RAD16